MSAAVRVDLTAARYGRRVFDYIASVEGSVLVNRFGLPWKIIYYNCYHQADKYCLLNSGGVSGFSHSFFKKKFVCTLHFCPYTFQMVVALAVWQVKTRFSFVLALNIHTGV